jgi:hypothetical protein
MYVYKHVGLYKQHKFMAGCTGNVIRKILLTPKIMSHKWEFSNFAVEWIPNCFVFGAPWFILRPRDRISCKVYQGLIKKADAPPDNTPPTPPSTSFPDHSSLYIDIMQSEPTACTCLQHMIALYSLQM